MAEVQETTEPNLAEEQTERPETSQSEEMVGQDIVGQNEESPDLNLEEVREESGTDGVISVLEEESDKLDPRPDSQSFVESTEEAGEKQVGKEDTAELMKHFEQVRESISLKASSDVLDALTSGDVPKIQEIMTSVVGQELTEDQIRSVSQIAQEQGRDGVYKFINSLLGKDAVIEGLVKVDDLQRLSGKLSEIKKRNGVLTQVGDTFTKVAALSELNMEDSVPAFIAMFFAVDQYYGHGSSKALYGGAEKTEESKEKSTLQHLSDVIEDPRSVDVFYSTLAHEFKNDIGYTNQDLLPAENIKTQVEDRMRKLSSEKSPELLRDTKERLAKALTKSRSLIGKVGDIAPEGLNFSQDVIRYILLGLEKKAEKSAQEAPKAA